MNYVTVQLCSRWEQVELLQPNKLFKCKLCIISLYDSLVSKDLL